MRRDHHHSNASVEDGMAAVAAAEKAAPGWAATPTRQRAEICANAMTE